MFYQVNLLNKYLIVYQISLNLDPVTENTMSDLYFNEECGYSEENTCDNEVFHSSILQPFQFEPEQKKMCGNESHEKENKYFHTSVADLLYIRIRKSRLEREGCISASSYYGYLPDY